MSNGTRATPEEGLAPQPIPEPDTEAPAPEELASSLIDIAERMTMVIARETELLAGGCGGDIAPLQEEKAALARSYAARSRQLKASRGKPASWPVLFGSRLRAAAGRLEAALADNAAALRHARSATDRILGIVFSAVREEQQKAAGYTRRRSPPVRPVGRLGIALDRSL